MEPNTKVIELSALWRLIGPTFWLVGAAYPFLVRYVELRELTMLDIVTPLAAGVAGLWFAFEASRRAVVTEKGIEFRTMFGRRSLSWSEVVGVDFVRANLVFRARDGSKYVLSIYATGAASLADETNQRCTNGA